MKLIILSGPAGVGKSTYAKTHYPDATILSSDTVGRSMGITTGNNGQVFDQLKQEAVKAMKAKDPVIVVDSTMASRRRRIGFLSHVRPDKFGYEVEIVQLHQPLKVIMEQNAQRSAEHRVPNQRVKEFYLAMQPPKVGLDCDSYTIIAPPIEAYRDELLKGLNDPHHSPYHLETLREHMQMTIDESISRYGEDSDVTTIARCHDLGKSVARTPRVNGPLVNQFATRLLGGFDTFKSHQNLSAMYYHIDKGADVDVDISDAILHHMAAHDGDQIEALRSIKRDNVSDRAIQLLYQFREIDEQARVFNPDLFELYTKLTQLDREVAQYQAEPTEDASLLVQFLAHPQIRSSLGLTDIQNPLFTFKYRHNGVDFRDPMVRNARGLTFNFNSEMVTIGFEKFFNYRQLESTDDQTVPYLIPYTEEFKDTYTRLGLQLTYPVWEKLDGTFLTLGLNGDEFVLATSSSTNLDYSVNGKVYFEQHPKAEEIKAYLRDHNLCLFFEYTSPENQIVVPYAEERYTLIGARHRDLNDTTVVRLPQADVEHLGLTAVHPQELTYDQLVDYQRTNQDSEGFVVENDAGKLVKFKTDYWFDQKQLSDLFFGDPYTDRKIEYMTQAILNDTIDDLIAYDNQRISSTHPVIDFKIAWDRKMQEFEDAIQSYKDLPKAQIAQLELETQTKSVVFNYLNGKSLEETIGQETFRRKVCQQLRDNLQQTQAQPTHINVEDLGQVLGLQI